jgi:hypothetical protein
MTLCVIKPEAITIFPTERLNFETFQERIYHSLQGRPETLRRPGQVNDIGPLKIDIFKFFRLMTGLPNFFLGRVPELRIICREILSVVET